MAESPNVTTLVDTDATSAVIAVLLVERMQNGWRESVCEKFSAQLVTTPDPVVI